MENKHLAVKKFEEIILTCSREREDIKSIELTDDEEYVKITYVSGLVKLCNVSCDSVIAILEDVSRFICRYA